MRPDYLYDVSKAFGEALGRQYHDQFGSSVICLRIGWFLPGPDEISRWTWLSPRDCAQVTWRAIEGDLGFAVLYAISRNGGRDLQNHLKIMGLAGEIVLRTKTPRAPASELDASR